jgi:8-oxo-dGTP pyrophosphatase MutT (NUDIX family)
MPALRRRGEMGVGRFYAGVGALLWHPAERRYLLLQRSPEKDFGAGGWECVTGRVDQGEGFSDAVCREVHEELGIEVQMDFVVGTSHFYRGEARPENEMVFVQFCCSIADPGTIRMSAEHVAYRWVTAAEAEMLLHQDHWLVEVIQRAETIRSLLPPALIAYRRKHGFAL